MKSKLRKEINPIDRNESRRISDTKNRRIRGLNKNFINRVIMVAKAMLVGIDVYLEMCSGMSV